MSPTTVISRAGAPRPFARLARLALLQLTGLADPDRHSGEITDDIGTSRVEFDGVTRDLLEVHALVDGALRAGGLYVAPNGRSLAVTGAPHHALDPTVVAEGRAAS